MKKFFPFIAIIGLIVGCQAEEQPTDEGIEIVEEVHVTGISLDKTSVVIKEEESVTLYPTIAPSDAKNKSVTWSTSDPEVVLVNNGVVTGIKAGNAVVTVTTDDGNKKATCNVEVASIPPLSVTVGADHISAISAVLMGLSNVEFQNGKDVIIGFQYSTMAGLLPSNSEMQSVSEIDEDSTFSLQLNHLRPNTRYYYRTFVRQNGQDTYGATMDFTTMELSTIIQTQGADNLSAINAKLNASFDLTDLLYSEKTVGFYMGKSSDALTDTLEVKEGTNSFNVELTRLEPSQEYFYQAFVILDGNDYRADMVSFTTYDLSTMIKTLDATGITDARAQLNGQMDTTNVRCDSLKLGFLVGKTEDEFTSNVSADTILENSFYSGRRGFSYSMTYWYKAYIKVDDDYYYGEVVPFTMGYVPVESVSIDHSNITMNSRSGYAVLAANVLPANASNKRVIWSSDNENVAVVDGVGKVFANGNGTATISATTQDQGKVSTCTVHVAMKVEGVYVYAPTTSWMWRLNVGSEAKVEAKVSPSDAVDQTLTWSSSDESVATVDQNGIVKGIGVGSAKIKATANDGGASDYCTVYVEKWVETVSFSAPKIVVNRGKEDGSKYLDITKEPSDASYASIKLESSNPDVVEVPHAWSSEIIAKSRGFATLTVTVEDGNAATATCEVEVKQMLTDITLDKTQLKMREGSEETISATIGPDNANDKSYTWSSSNEAVATVDETGKVTAISSGTAKITAKANDEGKVQAECLVDVKGPVSSISLNYNIFSIPVGNSKTLVATVKPYNAYNKSVIWSSSDPEVATVSNTGVVTGVKRGEVIISATSEDDNTIKATCTVRVILPVSKIELDQTSIVLLDNGTAKLVATVTPDEADDKSLEWTSSNQSVATVDKNGNVKAVSGGTAIITATAKDGSDVSASCEVTVRKRVTEITIDKPSFSLYVGETEQVAATVIPDDAYDKTFTWESTLPSIATVTSDGLITAIDRGDAIIMALAQDGSGTKGICRVKVKYHLERLFLNSESLVLSPGENYSLKIIEYRPTIEDEDKGVTWQSDNPVVATVDQNGNVIAVAKGQATIYAISRVDPSIYITCSVRVANPCPSGAVDLGITNANGDKVYWATCNLSDAGFVSSPTGYGDLYAWGETRKDPDGLYDKDHYAFYTIDNDSYIKYKLTKYCFMSVYGQEDHKMVLEPEDDAAHSILGGNWRIPTIEEWAALQKNCKWTWDSSKSGYLVEATNGNSIFIPAILSAEDIEMMNSPFMNDTQRQFMLDNASGEYWSATLSTYSNDPNYAAKVSFTKYSINTMSSNTESRYVGLSIRPVSD